MACPESHDPACDRSRIVEIQQLHRAGGLAAGIGGDRDDAGVIGPKRRLSEGWTKNFYAGKRLRADPFDQDEVDRRQSGDQFSERRWALPRFMHKCPARAADQDHLFRAGLAMAKTVLAGLVQVDRVMGIFDRGNAQAGAAQKRQYRTKQCRLAAAGPAGQAEQKRFFGFGQCGTTSVRIACLGKVGPRCGASGLAGPGIACRRPAMR